MTDLLGDKMFETGVIENWTPDQLNNPQGYSDGAAKYVQVPDDYFEKPVRQSYPVPKDTSSVYVQPPLDAATMFVVNMSTQVAVVQQPDTGQYIVGGGSTGVIPLRKGMAGGIFQAFLQSNYTGSGLIELWFTRKFYPPNVTASTVLSSGVTILSQPVEVKMLAGDMAVGAAVDGAIVTLGNTTDAAQTGANGSVIAQLKGIFTRIVSSAADAVATTIGMLQIGGFNGATVDRLRTLAASGFGLGALLFGRVTDSVTTTTGFAAIAAGNVNAILNRNAVGIDHRTLVVNNGTNVTLTINVIVTAAAGGSSPIVLAFTITTLGVCVVTKSAGFAQTGTYTKTVGLEAGVDSTCVSMTVQILQNAAATSGNCVIDLNQEG